MADLSQLNLNKFLYRESNQISGDSFTPDTLNGDATGSSGSSGSSVSSGNSGSVESDPANLTSGEWLGDVYIVDGFLRSKNFVTGTAGWTINADGSVEFDNGYFRGDITGASGTFSGTLTGGSLNIPDITTASSFHVDTTGNAWWGTNIATGYVTAPAKILATGAATFSSVYITGGTIDIGATAATSLHINATGDIWLGADTYNIATNPFAVSNAGVLRAVSGTIGGWTLSTTTLSATGIILDSTNQLIQVGSATPITIDGANKHIHSDNYVTGVNGTGFYLDSNLLEVGNIYARGMIRTAVFQKDVISTVGGNLMVLAGDVLATDMTALDS